MPQRKNTQTEIFSVRLGELAGNAGLTQKELAAATGLAQSTISHYMRGARAAPRVEEVRALANYFRVSIEWLLGADGSPPARQPDLAREEIDRRNAELRTIIANIEEQLTKLRALAAPSKRSRRPRLPHDTNP